MEMIFGGEGRQENLSSPCQLQYLYKGSRPPSTQSNKPQSSSPYNQARSVIPFFFSERRLRLYIFPQSLPDPGFAVTDKNMQLSHIFVAMAALSVSAAPMMERMLSSTSPVLVLSLMWKQKAKQMLSITWRVSCSSSLWRSFFLTRKQKRTRRPP